MRYLHMILLRDLRPPWLTHNFPQALPGDAVLSRYTRPSFLQWSSDLGAALFGDEVRTLLGKVTSAVSLDVAGFLARPLYVCTNNREFPDTSTSPEMRMSIALMSKLAQQARGRLHYRCKDCIERAGEEPVSDSSPLRVLHLYVLVSAGDGGLTPLRMKPLRLVVEAPPDDWGWGEDIVPPRDSIMAEPTRVEHSKGELWQYSGQESAAIWRSSCSYQGEETS